MSDAFAERFGRPPTVTTSAPGRVNLIGEHLDYNGGAVLPIAIPQRTFVELAPRDDRQVKAWSVERGVGEYLLGGERRGQGWLDYVQGVTQVLAECAGKPCGFELRLHSQVPAGSGLSSSAALEVALLRGLRELWSLKLGDVELAQLGQRAENEFVGARVGIMDQMAASLASETEALLLDTHSLRFERVPLPAGVALIVIDSGLKHELVGGDYNQRRRECEEAALALGVEWLCTLTSADLARVEQLREPLKRRARHVVTEHQRVHAAVRALRAGDLVALGPLLNASHASMRDDFEVSLPDLDRLVAIAQQRPEVIGARLTGGGFGGSVVVLTGAKDPAMLAGQIAQAYAVETARRPTVVLPMQAAQPS